MIDWHQGRVATDGAELRYFRSGGDLPPLVLIHGLTDHALYFTRVAARLADQWDVVAYDARGHGESSPFDGDFDEETRVADLIGVIDGLGLDRPALVGHSMGGCTITLALAEHPGLSRGAVLEDPGWWEPPAEQKDAWDAGRRAYFAEWLTSLRALRALPRAEALAQRAAEEPDWDPVDVATALDGRYAVQLDALDHFGRESRPWRPLVARWADPALVLIGDQPSAVVRRADAEEAATLNPRVDVTLVEGAGHHIKFDRFDAFVAAVTGFLDPLR